MQNTSFSFTLILKEKKFLGGPDIKLHIDADCSKTQYFLTWSERLYLQHDLTLLSAFACASVFSLKFRV